MYIKLCSGVIHAICCLFSSLAKKNRFKFRVCRQASVRDPENRLDYDITPGSQRLPEARRLENIPLFSLIPIPGSARARVRGFSE
jgi:hypothetical protein